MRHRIVMGMSLLVASAVFVACGDEDSSGSGGSTGGMAGEGSGATGGGDSTGGTSSDGGSPSTGGAAGAGMAGEGNSAGAAGFAGATAEACASDIAVSGPDIPHNHGHTLTVPLADIVVGEEMTYTTEGGAHDHDVTVTADDFAALRAGESVTITSTEAGMGMDVHSLDITLVCE